jgi:hypothetical protein
MKEIAAAFVKAQSNFLPAIKSSENPFFNSKYADLASCIDAVIGSLNANGIALVQHTSEADKGVIVHTTFLHESGEIMETGSIFFPAVQNTPQAFGSALTYARRYSLMTACGIAPEDDDGHAGSQPKPQTTQAPTQRPANTLTTEPTEPDYWATPFGAGNNATPIGIETCQHGDRVWRDGEKNGRAWGGWACPADKPHQCAMKWYVLGSDGQWKPQV